MAAARDAGNRHARRAGRKVWAVADWNHACEVFARLWPVRLNHQMPDLDAQASQEPRTGANRMYGSG
jgi:hypothetical protein